MCFNRRLARCMLYLRWLIGGNRMTHLRKMTIKVMSIAYALSASGAVIAQDEDPGLKFSATATGTYSNNYLRLSGVSASERPMLVPQEYSLVTNAILGWNQKVGRQYVYVNADAGYRFNKNNSYLDTESISANAGINWKLGAKCNGGFATSYTRSQGDFESLDDIIHNQISRKSISADARCLIASRWGVVFGANADGSDNSAMSRSLNDLKQQQLSTGLRLELKGDDYISAMVRQIYRQYDNRIVAPNTFDKNKQLNIGLELQKSFGPRITVDGWLGYSKLTNEILPAINFKGISGRANLSYSIGARHVATLGARREVESNANLTASHINVKAISFDLASNWGARMHSRIAVSQDIRDIALLPMFVSGSSFNNAHDKTRMVNASLGYDVGRLVTVTLSGRIADRNALLDRFDFSEKAVMFSLNFRYE